MIENVNERVRQAVHIIDDLIDIAGERMTSQEYIALRDAKGFLAARVVKAERFGRVQS